MTLNLLAMRALNLPSFAKSRKWRRALVLGGVMALECGSVKGASTIGDLVWHDWDGDGLQASFEPGLAGVRVELWSADLSNLLSATLTNSDGHYELTCPGPGNYRVRVMLPNATDKFTPKNLASDGNLDSDINPDGDFKGFTDVLAVPHNSLSLPGTDAGLQLDEFLDANIGDKIFIARADGTQPGYTFLRVPPSLVELLNEAGAVAGSTMSSALHIGHHIVVTTKVNGTMDFFSIVSRAAARRLRRNAVKWEVTRKHPHPAEWFIARIRFELTKRRGRA